MTARHKVSKVVQYGKLYFFDSENIFGSLRSLPTIKSQRPNKPAPLRSVPGSFPEIYILFYYTDLYVYIFRHFLAPKLLYEQYDMI